jgi:hypothetical protein
MSRIFFVTFGGGDQEYHDAVKRICEQAKAFEIFDEIIGMTDNDLTKDEVFWQRNGDWILKNKRGYGYWIWKYYTIYRIMTTKMNDNDIIMYADSGCELNVHGKKRLCEYFEFVKIHGSLAMQLTCLEKTWTKMDLLKKLNGMMYRDTGQVMATVQFYLKNDTNKQFLKDIYEFCISNNYHYLDNSESIEKNDITFVEHRHDQSIFSLWTKSQNKFYISDETYFEHNWNDGLRYPVLAMRNRSGIPRINF